MTDSATKRQELLHLLRRGRYTARELAEQLDLPERDVEAHLPHVLRSIAHDPRLTFLLEPSTCRDCGFRFRTRTRFTRPGRCPRCRSEDITSPRFEIADADAGKA